MSVDGLRVGGLRAEGQKFGELERDSQSFEYASFDGGLGLGLPVRGEEGQVSIVRNLVEQGSIDRAVVSLFLSNDHDPASSALLFGGVDEEHFTGALQEVIVPEDAAQWEVKVDGLVFGENGIEHENMRASFDSMSAFISLPSEISFYL